MNPNKKNIEIIKQFNLSPHPEGGWFREIVRSKNYLIGKMAKLETLLPEFIIFWREMQKVPGTE